MSEVSTDTIRSFIAENYQPPAAAADRVLLHMKTGKIFLISHLIYNVAVACEEPRSSNKKLWRQKVLFKKLFHGKSWDFEKFKILRKKIVIVGHKSHNFYLKKLVF